MSCAYNKRGSSKIPRYSGKTRKVRYASKFDPLYVRESIRKIM